MSKLTSSKRVQNKIMIGSDNCISQGNGRNVIIKPLIKRLALLLSDRIFAFVAAYDYVVLDLFIAERPRGKERERERRYTLHMT